jgi:hypothetical protein
LLRLCAGTLQSFYVKWLYIERVLKFWIVEAEGRWDRAGVRLKLDKDAFVQISHCRKFSQNYDDLQGKLRSAQSMAGARV